ncbi:DUF5107 domain-containing protein, partial [Actinotalea sp. C106]|uniref:DUF5107 domain-containing protein n=1 Tax=Actinotalea sp. C106 TaxID=2908644 RepID=UPI002028806B
MDDSVDLLPDTPAELRERLAAGAAVAWRQPVVMPTYAPAEPERYPMFLERRVYQGASGRVYPLPFVDGVADRAEPRAWEAIHLENRWLRLMVMPELGGRVHVAWDKTAGYDLFYRNRVIKPALVGLAGPWISGGLELNWPQHHRPTTFLPVATQVEEHEDGAVTVWCSDHDPFARMKGMHGIRLHPDLATLELVVRLHNRTEDVQTVMWWANVAARAHDGYQSFFPTDVRHVADHARRAITAFPRADRPYYGIDYPARVTAEDPEADRLDLFRNIPVPTSYMVLETQDDFFGGYDHHAQAGFVHWADRRIAPGKKQWTWGNAAFGQAWDRQLTDEDGPYVELMAGVFTDNQPDFSFLRPGETRTFSQYWFPIHRIGPAHQATREAAVSLTVAHGVAQVGVASARGLPGATVRLERAGLERAGLERAGLEGAGHESAEPADAGPQVLATWTVDLAPGSPLVETCPVPAAVTARDVALVVEHAGRELLRWGERPDPGDHPEPAGATRPPRPAAVP